MSRRSHGAAVLLLGCALFGCALFWGAPANFVLPQHAARPQLGEMMLAQFESIPSQDAGATFNSPAQCVPLAAFVGLGVSLAFVASRAAVRNASARGPVKCVARKAQEGRALRPRDRADGHGWIKEDPVFVDTDESLVEATHSIELKKRPSGITRYTHGADGKGAMVMEMTEKARYPGDPFGQAAVAGVKKGYVVKSVNGQDVRGWDFEDIMDLLEDFAPDPDAQSAAAIMNKEGGRERKYQAVEFPVTIEYMQLKESTTQAGTAAKSKIPEGAWMPRMEGWDDADRKAERERAMKMDDAPADYVGPRYTSASSIDDAWLKELMELQEKGGNLPKKDAYLMVLDIIDLLKNENTVGDIEIKTGQTLTVFGDIHGQYYDLLNMLKTAGLPSKDTPFLFNGDFVDRGSWSMEVIILLYAFKLKNPDSVFFNRGNHEMLETNIIYGFAGECGMKYDMGIFNLFSESFRNLPLLHLVNKEVLVVHAGLPGPVPRVWHPGQTHDPEDAVPLNLKPRTIDEIRQVDRYTEITPQAYIGAVDDEPQPEEKWQTDQRMIIDFLWADPRGGAGYGPSYRKSRGVFMFGPDVTNQFVEANNLKLVIRSHEVKAEGHYRDHQKLLSVFSAPNYLDVGGNKGAFLQLTTTGEGGSLEAKPISFTAVPHPDLAPMHYQEHIIENYPHLTRTMRKKKVDAWADLFGDSDFAGYQGPDEWVEVDEDWEVDAEWEAMAEA